MNEIIIIKIVTPLKILLECEASIVVMDGEEGVFGVLPKHSLLIANLKVGLIRVTVDKGNNLLYFVDGGIAQVTGKEINVVTEFAVDITKLKKNEVIEKIVALKEEIVKETNVAKSNIIKASVTKYEALLNFIH